MENNSNDTLFGFTAITDIFTEQVGNTISQDDDIDDEELERLKQESAKARPATPGSKNKKTEEIEEEEEVEEEEIDEVEEEEVEDKKLFGRKNREKEKVVSMPQAQSNAIKMVISQPTTFEQSDEICSFLKEKKSVIVNLEYVNKDVARRIVDFISGGVYALDGYIQKVSNSIFLVAPSNYEITNEMAREEIKNKLSVSWLRNNSNN